MYAPSHARGTIRNSTATNCHGLCIALVSTTGTCPDLAASAVHGGTPPTQLGITPVSVVLRITCRPPEFRKSLDDLIELAKHERIAVMCAEAVPWRCHRSLIADALLAQGVEVREISTSTRTRLHTMTPWAQINGSRVSYPGDGSATRPSSKRSAGTSRAIHAQ